MTGNDPAERTATEGDPARADLTEAAVRERLENVIDPCSEANGTDLDVIEMGLLRGIEIDGGDVTVDLRLTSPHCMMVPFFIERIGEEVAELGTVEAVEVTHDAGMEWTPDMITESGRRKRERAQSHLAARGPRREESVASDPGR